MYLPIVYKADQHNFDMCNATMNLANGKTVVLYVKSTGTEEGHLKPSDASLSCAEISRYHTYKSAKAAQQFLHGRQLIRCLLASHLGVNPKDIELTCKEHEKPEAYCPVSSQQIPQFNLSHSGQWVVLAADKSGPVGIDIECAGHQEVDLIGSPASLFTQNERVHLANCTNTDQRARLFLQLWRGKEAIMKATGKGFGLPPNSFDLLTSAGNFRSSITIAGQKWDLEQLHIQEELDCAIARNSTLCAPRDVVAQI